MFLGGGIGQVFYLDFSVRRCVSILGQGTRNGVRNWWSRVFWSVDFKRYFFCPSSVIPHSTSGGGGAGGFSALPGN